MIVYGQTLIQQVWKKRCNGTLGAKEDSGAPAIK
jgi:hypothetical protein